jgi:hypothetical protein
MSDLDPKAFAPRPALRTVGLKPIESAALARLIEEVRNTRGVGVADATAYNRTYHRHNR